ncbi:MAG TPA: DUF4825 domain-containing protein [Peptococcaceae bacterium]|nr:DUF4825 domain-containing protein [Peptococcaceae bacterium]
MKKTIRVWLFILAILSILAVAACSSQQNVQNNPPRAKDYKEELYQLKDTYTGDNVKVHKLVDILTKRESSLKSLEFTLELETSREPYGIKVYYFVDGRANYRFLEDIETAWRKNAAILFSLIPNAGEIAYHLQDEYDVFAVSYYTRVNLSKFPGLEYFTDDNLKHAADSMESFSSYLLKVEGIKNVSEFYSPEQKLYKERARQVYELIGDDYDFYLNDDAVFSALITDEFIAASPLKALQDHREQLLGVVGKEIDFIIFSTRNYKTGDWFGPPYLCLFDGERLVTYVNLENGDGQREVQESLKAIEKMAILKTKLSARYYLAEGGDKTVEYFIRTNPRGQKDLLDGQGKVILTGFENYDLILNYIFAQKGGKWGLYDQNGKLVLAHSYEEILNPIMPDGYKVNGPVRVKAGGLWGAINQDGEVFIEPQYDFIHMTYYEEVEPFVKVEKDGKFGYITWDGKPLVDVIWDAAFMDVLNVPEDIIFVKQGEKWGGIKVVNEIALPVDWNLQPSEEAKLSHNHWHYDYQWAFYRDQIRDGKTDISLETLLFFHDYFSKNNMELRLLPEFTEKGIEDEELFSHFIIANSDEGEWEDGFLSEADFDRYVKKYFGDLSYIHKTYGLLEHQDGGYNVRFGFSYHGSVLYEITSLEKGLTSDGNVKWKARINGYYFYEMDGSEEDEYQSENAKVVWQELKKPENKNYTFSQMRDRMLLQNPGKKLKVTGEWTIEFIVNDPLGDIYFTYLSCDSTWPGV